MKGLALDISAHQGRPPTAWFNRAAEVYKLGISQAWGGLPGGKRGPNPHCEYQLDGFRSAGMDTAIYIWVPPDNAVETRDLVRAALNASGEQLIHCLFVAPDLEGSLLHPENPGARLQNLIDNILALTEERLGRPLPIVIYCRANNWRVVMGGAHPEFAKYPVWEARYLLRSGDAPEEPPDLDWRWSAFGGWKQRAILQYAGTADTFGVGADWNVVDYERLDLKVPTHTPEPVVAPPSPAPEPPAPIPTPPSPVRYTVQPGDTLAAIAARFGTTWQALHRANAHIIADPNIIQPGWELVIPRPPEEEGEADFYVVQPGDTLFELAQEWGRSVDDIAKLNSIANPDLIRVGQRLRKPG